MKDLLRGQIQAIVPVYTREGGNFTQVKRPDGDSLVHKSTRSVLKDICRFYHYDLKSSNREYGNMLGVKKTPPIPFSRELILIAVKTRTPIGKDDGAFSYVNIEKIEEVKDRTIYFRDGNKLEVLSTNKTILKNIKLAKLLKPKIARETLAVRESPASYSTYLADRLSLKEDLSIIYRKLQEIEKILMD